MENQHKHIKGYRDLTAEEIALMNEIKDQGAQLGVAIDAIEKMEGVDKRFVAIARTQLQLGFMCLIRSIARPTTFI